MPFDHKLAVIINFVELAVTVVLLCTTPRVLGALRWIGQVTQDSALDTLPSQSISYFNNAIIVTIGHGANLYYKFQFKLYDGGSIDVRNTTGGDNAWKPWITLFTR